jgi:hypothetical protein
MKILWVKFSALPRGGSFKGHSRFDYKFYMEKYKIFTDYVLDHAKELPEF